MSEQDSNSHSDDSVNMTDNRIIFVGDTEVGKTSIISRIAGNPFDDTYEPSIGVDFGSKTLKFRGKNIKLQLWDTSGHEKYKGLIPSYVRNSFIVFLIYDVSRKSSFDNIKKWINFIRSIKNNTLVLCGNKIDLNQREVKKEEGEALAQKEGISFFEVSAKTLDGIKNMFFNSVADLSTFAEYNSKKENLVKELLQENEEENFVRENNEQELNQPTVQHFNVNGQMASVNNNQVIMVEAIFNYEGIIYIMVQN